MASTEFEPEPTSAWGSDLIADALTQLAIPFITLTPGASFRGLHDSLVNHLGNANPQMVLCLHEEHAVAIAHGYAKVTSQPLAVALHSNVGLMHASMAIFNAYADRVPMLIIGSDGPADSAKRRPWIDWLHTSADLGALVRNFVKWDDRALSAAAAIPSILRGNQLTRAAPQGPVFIGLDVAAQEERVPIGGAMQTRCAPLPDPEPARASLAEAAELLNGASRAVILMGRVSRSSADWQRRVELAEACNARVITHHKLGAAFPTAHPLHGGSPSLFLGEENQELLRGADVILSLDWLDLGGTLVKAFDGVPMSPRVISASLEHQLYNGWNKLDFTLPSVDVHLLCTPDVAVRSLLPLIDRNDSPDREAAPEPSGNAATPAEGLSDDSGELTVRDLQYALRESTAADSVTLIRVPFAWNFADWSLKDPLDYLGGDGGGGIGAGPGMAVGAALALRTTSRLPVAVLGDGDLLMGVAALWTATAQQIPLLIVVANNASFYNDEIHQQTVAKLRGRPLSRAHIGMRIAEPAINLADLARGQGWDGLGPVESAGQLESALRSATEIVRGGGRALVDVRVQRGYGAPGHNTTPH